MNMKSQNNETTKKSKYPQKRKHVETLTSAPATMMSGTFLAINRQPLERESCSNPLRYGFGKSSSFDWKNSFQFWL